MTLANIEKLRDRTELVNLATAKQLDTGCGGYCSKQTFPIAFQDG